MRDLPLCSYCALAKAKRSSFRGTITIPDQFEIPSLDGNVYKIGIIESKTAHIWMIMAEPKKVDGRFVE